MNEEAWIAALQSLRDEQQRLLAEMRRIDQRIGELAAQRSTAPSAWAAQAPGPAPSPSPVPALISTPPPLPLAPTPMAAPPSSPPSLPPALPLKLAPTTPAAPVAKQAPTAPPPLRTPTPAVPPKPAESLEMRVGSYWLVRIGVAILLTGLVFLATYLYQTITPRLGPAGKTGLLYMASGALLGLGVLLSRRAKEPRMQNFAAVVEAGGLAAVFFTTYAAHYLPGLQIISSPYVAGALLLAWAGFIIWLSSRRQSQTLAAGAIALMGYTTAVHPMGTFSLVANLIMVVAAIGLMWRHRWSLVSYAAMAASYGGYFYWRIFQSSPWSSRGEFWTDMAFLAGYWLLFAFAGFLGSEKEVPARRRAFLVGLNNSAFFALSTLLVVGFDKPHFWRFAIIFGAALLALGAFSHRRVDAATAGVYRMQGLLLITLAIVTYFSGWQLGLMLALQTLVLTGAASWRCSRVLLLAAILAGVLAAVASVGHIVGNHASSIILPISVTGIFLLAAAWTARHRPRGETPELYPTWFGVASGILSVLGPLVWFSAMIDRVGAPVLAPALAVVAVVLTLGTGPLRLPLLPSLGQVWFASALVAWFSHHGALSRPDAVAHLAPWWSPLVIIGAGLVLGRWWRSGALTEFEAWSLLGVTFSRALDAVGTVLILAAAVWPWCSFEAWLLVAPLLAVGVVLAARFLHDEVLGLSSQILVLAGAAALIHSYVSPPLPAAALAVVASVAPVLFAVLGKRFAGALAERAQRTIADAAIFYEFLSVLLLAIWIFEYIPRASQPLALALAAVIPLVANRFGVALRPFYFVAFATVSLFAFWFYLPPHDRSAWQNLAAFIVLALPFEWARRNGGMDDVPSQPLRAVFLAAFALSGWRWVSVLVWEKGGFYLAAAWAVYAAALLAIGLATRERVYRLAGFGILAATLIRVTLFDAWRLGVAYRMVSFMVLGAVLMTVGFLYNRYQDKLKEWL
jgi:uncharacterized membrane protein